MDYTIGQVSKLLGLSIEGIRKYEKMGIIMPVRSTSDYRKYGYLDITALIRAKTYRSFGFSMKETSQLVNDMKVPQIIDTLQEKRKELERECAMVKAKTRLIDKKLNDLETLEQRLDQPEIRMIPGFYRFEFAQNGGISNDHRVVLMFQKWMECIPFAHISTRYSDSNTYGGLAMEEQYAKLFDIGENDLIRYFPGGLCACVCVEETDNSVSNIACAQMLIDYAAYHRFEISHELIGHSITSIDKKNKYKRYREITAFILPKTT